MEYKLTVDQLNVLLDASQPTVAIKVGDSFPMTPQDNANASWRELGLELGFDYLSVRPVHGKGMRWFSADPTPVIVPDESEEPSDEQ